MLSQHHRLPKHPAASQFYGQQFEKYESGHRFREYSSESTEGGHADNRLHPQPCPPDNHGGEPPTGCPLHAYNPEKFCPSPDPVPDVHLDSVAYTNDLARVLNTPPREFGDVNHTVNAAQVNKGPAEVKLFTTPVYSLSTSAVSQNLSARALRSSFRTERIGTYRTTTAAVDLDDAETDFLLEQIIQGSEREAVA